LPDDRDDDAMKYAGAGAVQAVAPASSQSHVVFVTGGTGYLVGTPHPNPSKAREFREVDLASIREAARAAHGSGVRHFVYMSVAQPAPVMRAYVDARREGEACVRSTGIAATILRPWYILGPGHRWPALLAPLYALFELVPAMRATARRLGLVTLEQIVCTLVHAVEHPPTSVRVVDVANIQACGA